MLNSFTKHKTKDGVNKPSPDEVLAMLKKGNERFYTGKMIRPNTDLARLKLAGTENQAKYAYATVMTCSDSRVPVEVIFDAGVMDIFVIRIAGNVCGTDEIWSIEYGLGNVHTPVFLMLGHTQCGAVTVVTHNVQGKDSALESNLPPFADNIIPAVKRAMEAHEDVHGDEIIQYAIEENMWQGIENLFMNSPETRSLVHAGKVKVVAAVYDVGTGRARWFPSKKVDEILRRVEASPDRETERRG